MDKQHITHPADPQPAVLTFSAKALSYIFHPLFIPTYFYLWTLGRFGVEFSGAAPGDLKLRAIGVFITTAFFPALTVLLLWKLKFISNIYLRSNKERIVPYVAAMIFYWWMWFLSKGFQDQALSLKFFYFGIFIATIPALILNSFCKVSMHAMGMAGLATAMFISCIMYHTYYGVDLIIAVLMCGMVCSSRLLLKEHTQGEIYLGALIGILAQLVAYWIMI